MQLPSPDTRMAPSSRPSDARTRPEVVSQQGFSAWPGSSRDAPPQSSAQAAPTVNASRAAWHYLDMPTPLGPLRIAVRAPAADSASPPAKGEPKVSTRSAAGLAGAWFVDDQKYLPQLTTAWKAAPDHPFLQDAQEDIQAWFNGGREVFRTALSPIGTPFQEAVWQGLLSIPYGETESYAALTHRIGCPPTAVRAVAGAVGRNPISVLIPCHRVIGSDGALTGYAGGLPRKQFLLRLEQSGRQTAMPFSLQP